MFQPNAVTAPPAGRQLVPTLIIAAGDAAGWRYVEFFTANIDNDNTRRAYARACRQFFAWCEDRGLSLASIRPFDVAAWVRELQEKHGAPGVKQQLAAVRMLFDWLVTGQVVPMNPAAAVRGPEACGDDRQDAGALPSRMAKAVRTPSRPIPCAISATVH